MTDRDELITQWLKLTARIQKLQNELKPIEEELMAQLEMGIPVQIPKKSEKIVKRDRKQLNAEKLVDAVSDEVWDLITEPKPVADRIKVAIRDKRLTQETVDSCSDRSKSWLAITNK